jgi:6-phosphofructokinase 1
MASSKLARIAVLSSGTDNNGINSAIRAIVRSASAAKIGCYGVRYGFRGLLDDDIIPLGSRDVSGKIGKAGSFLGTVRPELTPSQFNSAVSNLARRNITGVVVIGSGGSLALSRSFTQHNIQVVGIPSTLQDDIVGTEAILGVDSALNNIINAIDHIRSCASSRRRTFLVQVEGRTCGSLAIKAAIVTGCEICLIPEFPGDGKLQQIADTLRRETAVGKPQCISLIANGWSPGIDELSRFLGEKEPDTDLFVRKTVLGYVQRGGSPTAADRLLGTKFGAKAVELLQKGVTEHFVGVKNNKVVSVPYSEFLDKTRPVSKEFVKLFALTHT